MPLRFPVICEPFLSIRALKQAVPKASGNTETQDLPDSAPPVWDSTLASLYISCSGVFDKIQLGSLGWPGSLHRSQVGFALMRTSCLGFHCARLQVSLFLHSLAPFPGLKDAAGIQRGVWLSLLKAPPSQAPSCGTGKRKCCHPAGERAPFHHGSWACWPGARHISAVLCNSSSKASVAGAGP